MLFQPVGVLLLIRTLYKLSIIITSYVNYYKAKYYRQILPINIYSAFVRISSGIVFYLCNNLNYYFFYGRSLYTVVNFIIILLSETSVLSVLIV